MHNAMTNTYFSGCLLKFDNKTWTAYTKTDGLSDNSIETIAFDKNGNVWVGSTNGRVSKFDGKNWIRYDKAMSCFKIVIDAQGNKWFGTASGVFELIGE